MKRSIAGTLAFLLVFETAALVGLSSARRSSAQDKPEPDLTSPPDKLPPGVKAGAKPGEFVCEADGAPMVFVPGGLFVMGVATSCSTDDVEAMPDRNAHAKALFVDKFEVTNGRYVKFLRAIEADGHKRCPKDEPKDKDHRPADWGTEAYRERSPGDDYPACGIDWHDARAYCAWAGKRLPTETEWEHAARGPDDPPHPFPWGDAEPRSRGVLGEASPDWSGVMRANWMGRADGFLFSSPVGSFPQGASPYGLEDAAGNVWEWTESSFELYPENEYEHLKTKWKEELGVYKVFRGGSFLFKTMDLQATHRHWKPSTYREADMGVRGVISAVGP